MKAALMTLALGLAVSPAAVAQNTIYDPAGLGFGGGATIGLGGTGPNGSDATDPFGAWVNITIGAGSNNQPLHDISVGFTMYYLPLVGSPNAPTWQCAPALYDGPPHGSLQQRDPWPPETFVQVVNDRTLFPSNVYYLKFHTAGAGFPIGRVVTAQLVCAARSGQF